LFIYRPKKKKTKENALVAIAIDYQMPVTQLRGVRGRWIYGAKRLFTIAHPATAPRSVDFLIGL